MARAPPHTALSQPSKLLQCSCVCACVPDLVAASRPSPRSSFRLIAGGWVHCKQSALFLAVSLFLLGCVVPSRVGSTVDIQRQNEKKMPCQRRRSANGQSTAKGNQDYSVLRHAAACFKPSPIVPKIRCCGMLPLLVLGFSSARDSAKMKQKTQALVLTNRHTAAAEKPETG